MSNCIRQIEVHDRSLIPAEAEIWIAVVPENHTPTLEVRGRLMGPRCPYSSTVEVAYPLRSLPRDRTPPGSPGLTMRVVIPEASLWEPESPFLYEGPIELWQDGCRCDRVMLSHGLRSIHLGERGLRVNGRPLMLRGRTLTTCSEQDARALRRDSCNLFVSPVEPSALPLWERADRLGFFVLGLVLDESEQTRQQLEIAGRHTSCLGWIIEQGWEFPRDLLPPKGLLGLACGLPPQERFLSSVHFLFGPANLANLGFPLLVKGEGPPQSPDVGVILGNVM